jgi:hypothetical protein
MHSAALRSAEGLRQLHERSDVYRLAPAPGLLMRGVTLQWPSGPIVEMGGTSLSPKWRGRRDSNQPEFANSRRNLAGTGLAVRVFVRVCGPHPDDVRFLRASLKVGASASQRIQRVGLRHDVVPTKDCLATGTTEHSSTPQAPPSSIGYAQPTPRRTARASPERFLRYGHSGRSSRPRGLCPDMSSHPSLAPRSSSQAHSGFFPVCFPAPLPLAAPPWA